ncbi:MAG: CcdB family protein [Acidiphilium sp.]
MAQFDVHHNPGRRREAIPYVVVLQSDRLGRSATRFVASLVRQSAAPIEAHYLAPRFIVDGIPVVLDVFNLATIPADRLGPPAASLADDESRAKLMRAMDEFLSNA